MNFSTDLRRRHTAMSLASVTLFQAVSLSLCFSFAEYCRDSRFDYEPGHVRSGGASSTTGLVAGVISVAVAVRPGTKRGTSTGRVRSGALRAIRSEVLAQLWATPSATDEESM